MDKTKVVKSEVIGRTIDYVKSELQGESSGHDWWHILRVRNNAMKIASGEKEANLFVVELAALLHDIADWKFHGGDTKASSRAAEEWLKKQNVDAATITEICKAIDEVSFKGAGVKTVPSTLEGKIVQDADRLDAMGAIGIARAFAYGGKVGREMYNPEVKPQQNQTFEAYKNDKGNTINHFYEKLLLLKDLMNTETGRKLAEGRHKFMEEYLQRFYKEWNGKL
ncbi:MAG: HD domain-containing protein [Candidatus Micrarchaeaceae archaeon]